MFGYIAVGLTLFSFLLSGCVLIHVTFKHLDKLAEQAENCEEDPANN